MVLAASLADIALMLLAVGGVSAAVAAVPWAETTLVVLGVAFLLYAGLATWRSGPGADGPPGDRKRWTTRRQVVYALSVSLLNPYAILGTVGVIGTGSPAYDAGAERAAFTAACVAVSWAFFCALAVAGRLLGELGAVRRWIDKVSAVVI